MDQKSSVKLSDTTELTCSCGHPRFKQAITMREVSAIMSGSGKNEIIPLSIIVCEKCDKQFEKSSIIT